MLLSLIACILAQRFSGTRAAPLHPWRDLRSLPQPPDALRGRHVLELGPTLHRRSRGADQLSSLRRMPEMHEGEIAELVNRGRVLDPVPEFIVLSSPADKRLVIATGGEVRVACRTDGRAMKVLRDGRRKAVRHLTGGEDVRRVVLVEIKREALQLQECPALTHAREGLSGVVRG